MRVFAPAAPDLMIRTAERGRMLLLSGARLGRQAVRVPLADPVAVRELHARFIANISRFRQSVGDDLATTPARAAEALVQLAEAGRVFLVSVLDSADDVHRLAECFRRACPTWRSGAQGRRLQIQSYGRLEEHLPWELLPVFDPRHIPAASTLAALDETCLPFGGFAAEVERRVPAAVPLHTTLDASGGLGIRFFYHAGYDGAQAEWGFLRAHADRIRLRGPYPDRERRGPSIGQQLRDPTVGATDGSGSERPDHVVHFACHCDTLAPAVDDYAFHLADDDGVPLRVTVNQLLNEIVLAKGRLPVDGQMPVVFLNACDSAALDARCGTGLLTPFVKNGNPAMIGTVASVPDDFAAAFSRRFYVELLAGRTLGAALFLARHHAIRQFANPLGILYCLYGNADLRLLPIGPSNASPTGATR